MSNRLLFAVSMCASLASFGCGDGPICPSNIVVQIASPTNGALVGVNLDNSDEPGLQIDIDVRSNLSVGDVLSLVITDGEGNTTTHITTARADGSGTFEGVQLFSGTIELAVAGESVGNCGVGSDSIEITVPRLAKCEIRVDEGVINTDFYSDLAILNASIDSDPGTPEFQSHITIETTPGFQVELFEQAGAESLEISQGVEVATDGEATYALTLSQGRHTMRAICSSASTGAEDLAPSLSLLVDTVRPTCALERPVEGSFIIPANDEDNDPNNGIQFTLAGHVTGTGDVEGEAAQFMVGALTLDSSVVDGSGSSSVQTDFASPGPVALTFQTQDHAGNACAAAVTAGVALDGCSIQHERPVVLVQTDADENTAGLQTALELLIDTECAGDMVTTTCDVGGERTFTVPADGRIDQIITVCDTDLCDQTFDCLSTVTSEAGIMTSAPATIDVDNRGPNVGIVGVNPTPLPCGERVAAEVLDTDPLVDGVQVDVRMVSLNGINLFFDVTDGLGGTIQVPTTNGVVQTLTLQIGTNDIVGVGYDSGGNETRTDICTIEVADLLVTFGPPVDDGIVNRSDDTVPGGPDVSFDICGTINVTGALVDVTINGVTTAATVTGTTWCSATTQVEGSYTITVTATAGARIGSATQSITIDITPPADITGLAVTVTNRTQVSLTWDAGASDDYLVAYSTTLIDDANFDSIPSPIVVSANSTEASVGGLTPGQQFYVALVSRDIFGNRSMAAVISVTPDFDSSGALSDSGATYSWGAFRVAAGDLNADGFSDIVSTAPLDEPADLDPNEGRIFIHMGSATGASASASTIDDPGPLNSTKEGLGYGVTVLDWNGDNIDDLAIGAPYGSSTANGAVYIFFGKIGFGGALTTADADVVIEASAASTTFGNGAYIGWSLATADFDGDNRDDLLIGAIRSPNAPGVGIVLFGGATSPVIRLHESLPSELGDAVGYIIDDPDQDFEAQFGQRIFNLGKISSTTGDDIAITNFGYTDTDKSFVVMRSPGAKPATGLETLSFSEAAGDLEVELGTTTPDTNFYFYAASIGSFPDLNIDTVRDIVVTAGRYPLSGPGQAWIIDGAASGIVDIADIALSNLVGGTNGDRFGYAVVNNSGITSPDLNLDGLEDLIIVSKDTLYAWFGGNSALLQTTTTAGTADYSRPAPIEFSGSSLGFGTPMQAIWAGDTNGDGIEDICWADHSAETFVGAIEVLYDDGN